MSDSEEDVPTTSEPSIPHMYISNPFLLSQWSEPIETNRTVYDINGERFIDYEERESQQMLEFEVVLKDEENRSLPISIEKTPYGLIINSNIVIPIENWNTIIDTEGLHWCCVCDNAVGNIEEHMKDDDHVDNMDTYQPLNVYDMSITRLIDTKYHCGVCNEVFEDEKTHYSSKSHENKMLLALNKATDIIYDLNEEKNKKNSTNEGCYKFEFNRTMRPQTVDTISVMDSVGSVNDQSYIDLNFYYDDEEYSDVESKQPVSGVSYASMAKKPVEAPKFLYVHLKSKKFKVNYDSWNMITRVNKDYYCLICKTNGQIKLKLEHCKDNKHINKLKMCKFVDSYEGILIRRITKKYLHCAHCNNIQQAEEIGTHITTKHPKSIIENLTENKDTTNQNRQVNANKKKNKNKSKKDKTKDNVNAVKIHIKECVKSENSIANVKVQTRENTTNVSENTDCETNDSNCVTIATVNNYHIDRDARASVQSNGTSNIVNNNKVYGENQIGFIDVTIHRFGYKFQLPMLSYNVVCKGGDTSYFCGICCVTLYGDSELVLHISSPHHIFTLNDIPFIPIFGINMLRYILDGIHCALCNYLTKDNMLSHLQSYEHATMVSRALGYTKAPPNNNIIMPPIQKMTPNSQVNLTPNSHTMTLSSQASVTHNPQITNKQNNMTNSEKSLTNRPIKTATNKQKHYNAGGQNSTTPNSQRNMTPNAQTSMALNAQTSMAPNSQRSMTPNFQRCMTPNFQRSMTPNFQRSMTPNAQRSMTPNTQRSMTPNSQRSMTPNSQRSMTPNFQRSMTPNAQRSMTPNTQRSMTPNSQRSMTPNSQRSMTPNFQRSMTPNAQRSMTPNTQISMTLDSQRSMTPNSQRSMTPNSQMKTVHYKKNQAKSSNNKQKDEVEAVFNNQNQFWVLDKEDENENNYSVTEETVLTKANEDTEEASDIGNDTVNIDVSLDSDTLNISFEETLFNMDEYVLVKLLNNYIKVTNTSYNSLLQVDGERFCFICDVGILTSEMYEHTNSRSHMENIPKCQFIDKYGPNLIRQLFLTYHCAICNVIIQRKYLPTHLAWRKHKDGAAEAIVKKDDNLYIFKVKTTKEETYLNQRDKEIKCMGYEIRPGCSTEKDKIVISGETVLKIGWESWNGIMDCDNIVWCILCQIKLEKRIIKNHIKMEHHKTFVEESFHAKFQTHLIRKVTNSILHCVVCNMEVQKSNIRLHLVNKYHKNNYENLTNNSENASSYTNCSEDVFIMKK